MIVLRGRTSQIVLLQATNTVTGGPKTGLLYTTTGLIAYYMRELDSTATAISLATMTAGTWSTGGFIELDATHLPGSYALSLPNAAISASDGSTWTEVYLSGITGVAFLPLRIDLVAYNPQDATRLGLTALPNAAANAVGGLPVLDANSLIDTDAKRINAIATTSVTTINANVGTTQPLNFTGTAGAALVKSDSVDIAGVVPGSATIGTVTTLTNAPSDSGGTTTLLTRIPGTVQPQTGDSFARLGAPAGASVSADIAEVEAETDGIAAIPTNPLLTSDTRLPASAVAGASGGLPLLDANLSVNANVTDTGTAQGGSLTGITLKAGSSAVDDFYKGQGIRLMTGPGAGQFGSITAYSGTTKLASVVFVAAPTSATTYELLAAGGGSSGGGGTDPLLNVVPGAYAEGTAGYDIGQIPAIQAETAKIGTAGGPINVTSTVVNGALGPLYLEDDYYNVDGRAVYIPFSGPSLLGGSVALNIGRLPASALFTAAGVVTAANVYYIEFSHTTLAANLRAAGYRYSIVGTEANGHIFTIAEGEVTIARRQA